MLYLGDAVGAKIYSTVARVFCQLPPVLCPVLGFHFSRICKWIFPHANETKEADARVISRSPQKRRSLAQRRNVTSCKLYKGYSSSLTLIIRLQKI